MRIPGCTASFYGGKYAYTLFGTVLWSDHDRECGLCGRTKIRSEVVLTLLDPKRLPTQPGARDLAVVSDLCLCTTCARRLSSRLDTAIEEAAKR